MMGDVIKILTALGITCSSAITLFYKQIILQQGLSFEIKLPEHPLDMSRMTDVQINAEIEKGFADMKSGRTIPANEAFANIRYKYNI